LTGEEAMRLMEMESRVLGLEDRLTRALDEVREARTREMNVVSLLRDIIGHLASVENGEWAEDTCTRHEP
jgi:osomolarity two-component system response regulator SKN7